MESETMGVARQATDPTAQRHYVQIVSRASSRVFVTQPEGCSQTVKAHRLPPRFRRRASSSDQTREGIRKVPRPSFRPPTRSRKPFLRLRYLFRLYFLSELYP